MYSIEYLERLRRAPRSREVISGSGMVSVGFSALFYDETACFRHIFLEENGLWKQKGQNVPKPVISRLWKHMFWHLSFFTYFWPKRPLEAKRPNSVQNSRFALMKTHVLTPHLFHIFLAKTAETYLGSVGFGSFALELHVFTWFCSPPGLQFNKNILKH